MALLEKSLDMRNMNETHSNIIRSESAELLEEIVYKEEFYKDNWEVIHQEGIDRTVTDHVLDKVFDCFIKSASFQRQINEDNVLKENKALQVEQKEKMIY